jgi:hypothetical protein
MSRNTGSRRLTASTIERKPGLDRVSASSRSTRPRSILGLSATARRRPQRRSDCSHPALVFASSRNRRPTGSISTDGCSVTWFELPRRERERAARPIGAAAPYFYEGRRGRYAALLERLALRGSDFFVFLRGGVCAEIRCARRSSARTVARLTLTTAEHAAAAGLDSAERLRGRAVSPVHAWTVEYQHTNVALPAPARPRRGSLLRRLSGRML